MRLAALGLIPLVLAGCGAKYKPTGPVMGDYLRSVENPVHKPHDNLRYSGVEPDRKSTRLNSSHNPASRMPSSA
jgi:hypothetical protein